ncbi:hypothetical protein AAHC03_04527 [Spirometra sp. Aus1]
MTSLIGEICHIFCCPPRPSHIVAKFAFLPPPPTYTIVQSANGGQRRIIFKPEAGHLSEEAKSRMEVFYTMTKRNSRIACLYIRYDPIQDRYARQHRNLKHSAPEVSSAGQPLFTVLFSHGNAVDIGQMAGFLQSLSQRFQVNILVYDYSGYGASSGQTLEDNLYADAEAALAELRARYLCSLSRVVLYGQSIGTAPTVELATHHKVAGVILHSALMSGLRVVCPGTTRRFCFDPFTNIDKVARIQSPTLVMHGTEDDVIGIHHGQELHARLPYPLEPLWVEGAGHNDIELFPEYTRRLDKFFKEDLIYTQNSPTLLDQRAGDQQYHQEPVRRSSPFLPFSSRAAAEKLHTINSADSASFTSSSSSSSSSPSLAPSDGPVKQRSFEAEDELTTAQVASNRSTHSVASDTSALATSVPIRRPRRGLIASAIHLSLNKKRQPQRQQQAVDKSKLGGGGGGTLTSESITSGDTGAVMGSSVSLPISPTVTEDSWRRPIKPSRTPNLSRVTSPNGSPNGTVSRRLARREECANYRCRSAPSRT